MPEKQWVNFEWVNNSPSGKTRIWKVIGSGGESDFIGSIIWHGPWRQYIFQSKIAIYNPACMRQIADFVEQQTAQHRARKAESVGTSVEVS